ncbi:MAG: DUF5666 domain-containing protein [Pseudomonadota bacterium]|jgi:hypothetical protein
MLRLTIIIAVLIFSSLNAWASPSDLAKARRTLTSIAKAEKDLIRTAKKLTPAERAKLKASRGKDSDGDTVNDVVEGAIGSNRCDADSDDDGLDDSDDSDEDSSDSDGDGYGDALEVEAKGKVTSFNDPVLVVAGKTFQVTSSTIFFRGLTSKADLTAGTCIEVEGHKVGAGVVADKIKRENDSGCGSGSGDD